jgi:hypothetical protein
MCTAIGWPIPFVTFTKGNSSLMNNANFTFKIVPEDSFTISLLMNLTYAKVEDTGDYYCLAEAGEAGEVGYDHRSFFLGVFGTCCINMLKVNEIFLTKRTAQPQVQRLVCIFFTNDTPTPHCVTNIHKQFDPNIFPFILMLAAVASRIIYMDLHNYGAYFSQHNKESML